jgi:hypothetical protein
VKRAPHPYGEDDCIRNQSMKILSRIVLGSVTSSLLVATSFFAIDGLMPTGTKAACYSEQCNRYSEKQNRYSKYQSPYSKYQSPYSKCQSPYSQYQNKYSSEYIPSCKKTGAC